MSILDETLAESEPMKTPAFAITPEYLRTLGAGMRREIIATLTPEDLKNLAPETRQRLLANLSPAERLAGLDPALIEAYLHQQQAQSGSSHLPKAKIIRRKPRKTKPTARTN
jgi:hypothetical protein